MFAGAMRDTAVKQFNEGQMETALYAKVVTATENPKTMRALMRQTELEPGLYGGIMDWDWEAILKWVEEYFIPLVKLLLPLILLLDEEE